MVAPFFVPKIGEDQKKGLRCKISGFSVQKYVKTKKKGLRLKISGFLDQMMRMGTTKQSEKSKIPQIGGVMVSHHHMVSPQNGDTRGWPPPSLPLAKPLLVRSVCCFLKKSDR